ncbi:MAG: thiamine phosphate synthase [Actinomycetota bacterium]|nr:thiamine phosphate synthase [Actinomycetota bacterium]
MNRLELGLYIITESRTGFERDHLDMASAALEGGADVLQLRDKGLGGREMMGLTLRMRELIESGGNRCLMVINDRLDVAVAAEADGVHLGQQDLPAKAARSVAGDKMIIGISASTVEEAERAQDDGADYLGVGPVYPTPTKLDAGLPIGVEGIRRIKEVVEIPIVAIGGIGPENLERVMEAGADGVAVISAISAAADMLEAVRQLRRAVDACFSGR